MGKPKKKKNPDQERPARTQRRGESALLRKPKGMGSITFKALAKYFAEDLKRGRWSA